MTEQPATTDSRTAVGDRPYDPPAMTRLGTLHEMTLGPFGGNSDGIGGFAGDEGSVIG